MNNSLDSIDSITQKIVDEITTIGTVTVQGTRMIKNSLSDNRYAGLCHAAAAKFVELAEQHLDLEFEILSFSVGHGWNGGKHVVIRVKAPEGDYIVDPTIRQYIPEAKMVYAPNETYPISIVPGSMKPITQSFLLHRLLIKFSLKFIFELPLKLFDVFDKFS